jgi:ubiquinone/menaquinone biosynthesis C-methylase UbiE
MVLKRDFTSKVNWVLDNLLPPIIRDNGFLMRPLFWVLFKEKLHYFMDFKEKADSMPKEQLNDYYKVLAGVHLQRETDLNELSLSKIIDWVVGDKVLDIACGRGFLAKILHEKKGLKVTGIDFNLSEQLKQNSMIKFQEGDIENIPFADNHFDTVVCAHTLEHVQNFQKAVSELRRVARKRLIVVVPRQREYKYTFDLHLHFFPYPFSLRRAMNNKSAHTSVLGNDLFYVEDY